MRLGVINRKIWGGNRNDTGARAQEVHMSTIGTCHQQHRPVIDFYHRLFCGDESQLIPAR